MTLPTAIELEEGMWFYGETSKEHIDEVSNFHNAVGNLLFQEQLGKECAVAIRRWYLEDNALHPGDSAPMGMLHNGCERGPTSTTSPVAKAMTSTTWPVPNGRNAVSAVPWR